MNFKEIFDKLDKTNFEIENNIKVISKEIILDTGDIKLIKLGKSTKEFGLIIIYKNSTKYDTWTYWNPSGNQQKQLLLIAKILLEIDNHNSQFWKGGKNESKY